MLASVDLFAVQRTPNLYSTGQICTFGNRSVFPYEYLDSFEKLNETKYPPFKVFYDSLKEKNINEQDYYRGKKLF
jgi:hypothetical protein